MSLPDRPSEGIDLVCFQKLTPLNLNDIVQSQRLLSMATFPFRFRVILVPFAFLLALTALHATIPFNQSRLRHRFTFEPPKTSTYSELHDFPSLFKVSDLFTLTKRRERVAVCLAGNTRTFYYNFVNGFLLSNTIAPLKKFYNTDVFFYIRLDDQPNLHRPAKDNAFESLQAALRFSPANITIVSNGTLDAAVAEFLASQHSKQFPISHKVVQNELLTMSDRVRFDTERNMDVLEAPPHCKTSLRARFPHSMMRSKQCLQMIAEHEEKLGRKYDWIYRIRPDTVFVDRVPLPYELNRSVAYTSQANPGASKPSAYMWHKTRNVLKAAGGPLSDQILFSSRHLAETLLNGFDAIDDCESYHPMLTMHAPENMLRLWLMKNETPYRALPFSWATLFEYSGPTCDKLLYQFVPFGQDWKRALRVCAHYAMAVQKYFPESIDWSVFIKNLPNLNRSEKHMELYNL